LKHTVTAWPGHLIMHVLLLVKIRVGEEDVKFER
jgi:uncharacterized membrane protein